MGQPDSVEINPAQEIALAALDPNSRVSIGTLRKSGLHREVLARCYEAFSPEIKNLVGWRKLSEYVYKPHERYVEQSDVEKGKILTERWHDKLNERGLGDEHAVLLFDGERERPPAPDYRLYVLRDGRLLWYEGGFYASMYRKDLVCGDTMTVMAALDEHYPNRGYANKRSDSFAILMTSFSKALDVAIAHRKKQIEAQETLNDRIKSSIAMLGDK